MSTALRPSLLDRALGSVGLARAPKAATSTLANHADWLLSFLGGLPSKSGQRVTPETAMRCAAVYACVRVLSESVAQLPLVLYRRRSDGGKERATDHPLYGLLHDGPNGWQSSFEFRELLQARLLLRGNAYAWINRVGLGRKPGVREVIPLHPDRVTVEQRDDFSLVYHVTRPGKDPLPIPQANMLHLRGLSDDGLLGLSPITQAREAIGLALATEEHGAFLFRNGARPSGILQRPKEAPALSKEAGERLLASFIAAHGGENQLRTALLEEGTTFLPITMTSEDAQFLETRKYQRSEIASLFRVPPHMIGDLERATFSNIEQQSLEFVVHSLGPWLRRWEQAITRDLLTPDERETYFAEFLVDALLRGDIQSRYNAYSRAILDGWMTRNEVRTRENLNPEAGLDEFLTPLNMHVGSTPPPPDSPAP